jgi:hypothetical protein
MTSMTSDEATAIVEIQQLLFRYCRGVDRGELATLKSVYHPNAHDHHGAFVGLAEAFADELVPKMDKAGIVGQHHITNVLVEVDGDRGVGESYFLAYHPTELAGAAGEGLAVAGGRYLDRFERRDGVWKITDRRVIFDFSVAPENRTPWRAHQSFLVGGRREADPSHGFFDAAGGSW